MYEGNNIISRNFLAEQEQKDLKKIHLSIKLLEKKIKFDNLGNNKNYEVNKTILSQIKMTIGI